VKGRQALAVSVLVFVTVLVAAAMLIPDYGDNRAGAAPMAPQAVNRIAQKNNNAAVDAAAEMRARSARDARLVDQIQDQQDRARAAQPAH
jgi:hypothetical protein